MSARGQLAEIPQPLRWATIGAVVLTVVGATYGVVESVRNYPPSSWFGVTLYVTVIGATAGFFVGLIAGVVRRLLP